MSRTTVLVPRLAVVAMFVLFAGAAFAADAPVRVIFDTDIQGDVDDVGTVALLHALAARGEVEILAMGVSCKNEWSPLCLDALNTYFGRSDIPLGVVEGPAFYKPSKYAQQIAEEFPHALKSAKDAQPAVDVYRKALAAAESNSVVMLSVGQLTNLAHLLESPPDDLSQLGGHELVRRKVKVWVCMGCKFPEGREANIIHDGAPAKYAIDHWPTPIIFSGWEIGRGTLTGGRLKSLSADSPVRRAYELFNGIQPHNSYDQTAALYAARGLSGGLDHFWKLETTGHCQIDDDGTNRWIAEEVEGKDHAYLIQRAPKEEVARMIEELMLWVPGEA